MGDGEIENRKDSFFFQKIMESYLRAGTWKAEEYNLIVVYLEGRYLERAIIQRQERGFGALTVKENTAAKAGFGAFSVDENFDAMAGLFALIMPKRVPEKFV